MSEQLQHLAQAEKELSSELERLERHIAVQEEEYFLTSTGNIIAGYDALIEGTRQRRAPDERLFSGSSATFEGSDL